jgi:Circularly permutated YpsA SLOG family/Domain of unknown function (DUF6794)
MTIKKIISSGTLGTESAALDVAIRLKIPYGGYAISSPVLEIERRNHQYRLTRKSFQDSQSKDEANLQIAEGTLIFSHGLLTDDLDYLRTFAQACEHPCLHIDLAQSPPLNAAFQIDRWARRHTIETLFITGATMLEDGLIYQATYNILYSFLMIGKDSYPNQENKQATAPNKSWPRTVDEAVQRLIEELPLKDKTTIANMSASELAPLNNNLGRHIRNWFGLNAENHTLLWSCAKEAGKTALTEKEASAIIISCLALELEKTHKLRIL